MITAEVPEIRASMWPVTAEERQAAMETGFWRDETMLDDVLGHVRRTPHKAALVSYSAGRAMPETMTYGQLGALIDRIAGGLLKLGVARDDVVSVQMPNGWRYAVVSLAVMRVGAIVNPLVAIFRRRELTFMLQRAQSKVLVVQDEFRGFSHADMAAELKSDIAGLEAAVVANVSGRALPEGTIDFEEFFLVPRRELDPSVQAELEARRPRPDDPISVMYTSGTTGEPKGTLHSYNSMYSAGRPLFDNLQLDDSDVVFMPSTMGHLTGFLWGTLLPLAYGQKVVYQDIWSPADFLQMATPEGVTWTLSATPFVLDLVRAQQAERRDLSTFKYFVCAGAPIPSSLPVEASEVLGVQMLALWGSSECGIITIHRAGDSDEAVSNSDGWRTPPMTLKITGEDGREVEPGQTGRLLVKGPSLLRGYHGRPDLYESMFDQDGWFDTGDLGFERPGGGVRIAGRSKDIIIRGGENVPVVEIESVLHGHPSIREVVVVGYPDERLGEKGCAVIVPDGEAPTLEELQAHLDAAGMARQYWPERIKVIDEMPKTPAGKVQKFVLREVLATEVGGLVFDVGAPAGTA
jgi:cyclohexanecarboxylate-CoA ligase